MLTTKDEHERAGAEACATRPLSEQPSMSFMIGIDVGGTFTDGVVISGDGGIRIFKTPTTPANPSQGFLDCIQKAAGSYGMSVRDFLGQTSKFTYGTTMVTNILLQGKGSRVGVITTKGFRDTLPIARIGREYLDIDLQVERPPALTPRSLIEEVVERVDYKGAVITPLDEESVRVALHRLRQKQVEAIAVCLLWSFKLPGHERRIREIADREMPGVAVCLSSDIAPLIGEYERSATATLNAGLMPPVRSRLAELSKDLQEAGLACPLLLMQSTGGVTPSDDAATKPVTLINSGPTGGVIASKYLSDLLGIPNLINVDMGGTSFDVSLITGGQYSSSLVSRVSGHNIFVPMVDVYSIGAGGGSIAWLDMGRRLKVGPLSAQAVPGPACYGRGGEQPTVTDADVVLGRVNPAYFLGGEMPLDVEQARKAILTRVASALGMTVEEAAAGICQIVDANMSDAIRMETVQKGYDPRDYTLVAFGGAGATHASALARELGIKKIIVPFLATAQSAFGVVASDIVHNLTVTDIMGLDDPERVNRVYADLELQGHSLLEKDGLAPENMVMARHADIRYRGQAHEVTVPMPSGRFDGPALEDLQDRFEQKYVSLFGPGTAFREAGLEIVTLRVDATGRTAKPALSRYELKAPDPGAGAKPGRQVYFAESKGFVPASVYNGEKLEPGNEVRGPAIVEYKGTTAVVHPGQKATVDAYKNLVLEWEP
ncbi:MAG: hydantoinase/oxoprolinase family protein [Chloroflexi bacterium]|nr:hydantoinase/oxoprolinase family protein [Chloroflexota bacterium]